MTERTIYRLPGAKKTLAFKDSGTWRFSRPNASSNIDEWIRRPKPPLAGEQSDDATGKPG
jgi:hypothetical protein